MKAYRVAACLLAISLAPALCVADNAPFDLVGPKIDIRVTRGSSTLPIAEVPNLLPGDRLWIKADLPRTQSNHLLLVVAFLRGTTNVPPNKWFTEIDTWDKKTIEGTTVKVPVGAEQALLFIAPQTGGDFKTLRSAVRGHPGIFIRAAADLNASSLQQQRIEHYLAAMQSASLEDAKAIEKLSARLAATLALKPDANCFKQPVDQQVGCLTQSSTPDLLDEGNSEGIASSMSSGASANLINEASGVPAADGGLYSAYVGSIVDLVYLIGQIHTADYRYIPGLTFPEGDTLNLRLNAPPSFLKPESVIVIGLPAIQKAKLPPLLPPHANEVVCLLQPKMVLPLVGAPLVFSTNFAHDLVLHLNRTGAVTDIPLAADAAAGGLVVTKAKQRRPLLSGAVLELAPTAAKAPAKIGTSKDLTVTGTIRGYWGFRPFEGPTLTFQQVDSKDWRIIGDTQLFAGQDNHLTIAADVAGCVRHIALTLGSDKAKAKNVDVTFKPAPNVRNKLVLDVSLKAVQPGGYSLAIEQYGDQRPDYVSLTAYTPDISLSDVRIHTGDDSAVLAGRGLQNVASVEIDKQIFTPIGDSSDESASVEILHLQAKAGANPVDGSKAMVKLKDGRTMKVRISTLAPRPSFKLVYTSVLPSVQPGAIPVTLTNKKDIPLDGTLTFVVQTKSAFPRDESIEVATANNALHTRLSLAGNNRIGNLVLEDNHTALGTLNLDKAFGESAFGRIALRPVAADGTNGDWIDLGTLVRTPGITAIHCSTLGAPTCTVDGNNFYLVQSFSGDKEFTDPTDVPIGFFQDSFNVPTPTDGTTLYVKLRDDPNSTATLTLPTPIVKPVSTPLPALPALPAPQSASVFPAATPAASTPATAEPATATPVKGTAKPVTATPAATVPAASQTSSTAVPPAKPTPGAAPAAPVAIPVSAQPSSTPQ